MISPQDIMAWRRKHHYRLIKAAEVLGVSVTTVHKAEHGKATDKMMVRIQRGILPTNPLENILAALRDTRSQARALIEVIENMETVVSEFERAQIENPATRRPTVPAPLPLPQVPDMAPAGDQEERDQEEPDQDGE